MKKIIVTGGRDFSDRNTVYRVLDQVNPDIIIHGNAKGVDTLCKEWAIEKGKKEVAYNAKWNLHGKIAGPLRNREMVCDNLDANLGIVFPGGKGTQDCFKQMLKHLGEKKVFVLNV